MAVCKSKRNDAIVDCLNCGVTQTVAAKRFGITRQRVQQIARQYGLPSVKPMISEDDATAFADLTRAGYSHKEAARAVRRTSVGLARACRRLGIVHSSKTDHHRPWTARETSDVKKSYHRERVADIAERLGRTRNEVIGKARRLGLCEPAASRTSSP